MSKVERTLAFYELGNIPVELYQQAPYSMVLYDDFDEQGDPVQRVIVSPLTFTDLSPNLIAYLGNDGKPVWVGVEQILLFGYEVE